MSFKFQVSRTKQFKKQYKLMQKQGKDLNKLHIVIELLAKGEYLPAKYKDHELKGNYAKFRELHIESDWLLIYQIDGDLLILELTATGSHSELF